MGPEGKLRVSDHPIVLFIEGDGTGPDIWSAAVRVLDAAVERTYQGQRRIAWMEVYAGEKAKRLYGDDSGLPAETLEAFNHYRVGIKGPLTTPIGQGFRSINVAMRQALDLYVCLRPVKWIEGVPSPVRAPQSVDMVVFRENTEDLYAGIEWPSGSPEARRLIDFITRELGAKIRFPESAGIGIKEVSREGSERLIRAAIWWALQHNRRSVTLVHKGNIMKYTEGAFRRWGYELAQREFGDCTVSFEQCGGHPPPGKLLIQDVIVDNFLQQIITRPTDHDVVATTNLNGDYISDALAAQVGGLGIAPGANINFTTGHACFEATHGTAPKYAGLDKVNPGSLILSGAMLLDYIGWGEAARLVEQGVGATIRQGTVTYDLARLMRAEGRAGVKEVRCSEFADEAIRQLGPIQAR